MTKSRVVFNSVGYISDLSLTATADFRQQVHTGDEHIDPVVGLRMKLSFDDWTLARIEAADVV